MIAASDQNSIFRTMLLERPALRVDACLSESEDVVAIEAGDNVYEVSGAPPTRLLHALSLMNGHMDVETLNKVSGLSPDTLQAVSVQLSRFGIVTSPCASRKVFAPDEFSQCCRTHYVQWKKRLFGHPLWAGLAAGTLPRSVFIGWVIESWWFIEGVIDRIPTAIASAENRAARQIFAKHFSEEWDHFYFFEAALDALGITESQRASARPLPATVAVQHWMRNSARHDPLRYAACSGFLESTGQDRQSARGFLELVSKWYDSGENSAVAPMLDHVTLDEDYGHSGFMEKVVALLGHVDAERARLALQDAYGLVETLEMWSTDILRHYSGPDALSLRPTRFYRKVQ